MTHPLSREERLVNAQEKTKGRLSKEAKEERSHKIRVKLIKEQLKDQETKDELERARRERINLNV